MDVAAALQQLSAGLQADEKASLKKELSAYLNHLLLTDFSALVQVLYRVDVSEEKTKRLLLENQSADAGDLLAELVMQRQEEKNIHFRTAPPSDIPNDESW